MGIVVVRVQYQCFMLSILIGFYLCKLEISSCSLDEWMKAKVLKQLLDAN